MALIRATAMATLSLNVLWQAPEPYPRGPNDRAHCVLCLVRLDIYWLAYRCGVWEVKMSEQDWADEKAKAVLNAAHQAHRGFDNPVSGFVAQALRDARREALEEVALLCGNRAAYLIAHGRYHAAPICADIIERIRALISDEKEHDYG
jgi:hypothetical protein